MPILRKRRLFTVEEYHRMGEVGILPEKGLELIHGELIEMSPIGSKHAATVDKITRFFVQLFQMKAIVRVQNPITIADHSEPEPDISILKDRRDYYSEKHPGPEDVYLLIEVADSSINFDRTVKLNMYAAAGIPETWIIDLEKNQIETYRDPVESTYTDKKIATKSDPVLVQTLDMHINASELLLG